MFPLSPRYIPCLNHDLGMGFTGLGHPQTGTLSSILNQEIGLRHLKQSEVVGRGKKSKLVFAACSVVATTVSYPTHKLP